MLCVVKNFAATRRKRNGRRFKPGKRKQQQHVAVCSRARLCMCVCVCVWASNDSTKREDVGSRLRRESLLYFEKGERFSLVFPVERKFIYTRICFFFLFYRTLRGSLITRAVCFRASSKDKGDVGEHRIEPIMWDTVIFVHLALQFHGKDHTVLSKDCFSSPTVGYTLART